MSNIKENIEKIFNILKSENIIDKDALLHVKYLMLSRYFTILKCKKYDIPLEFAFENFFKNNFNEGIDNEKALLKFYNENLSNCIFEYINKVLNLEKTGFIFLIKSSTNFANIYNKLNEITNEELENNDYLEVIMDIYLNNNKNKELTELYTNIKLCNWMVNLIKPKIKYNNEIETINDPFLGTGRLIIESIRYLNKNNKNINWNNNYNNIYGFDNSFYIRNIAIYNLFISTGILFTSQFIKNDTLFNDYKINDNKILDKTDIIISHMPYGLRNIIYKNVCKRIKELKIDGTKAEPLILQLITKSLNKNGRCAVIVPDNLLSNDAKLHKQTRTYLLENFNVKKIISIDNKLLNVDVKSSILYFENNGKTQNVEFSKIKLENNDKISEEIIITSTFDDIKNNEYSLLVNKYILKNIETIDNLTYFKLGELCQIKMGEKIKKSESLVESDSNNEKYHCYNGTEETYYQNKYNRENLNLIISKIKSEKLIIIINDKIWLNENGLTIHVTVDNCDQKYLNYYLLSHIDELNICYNSKEVISIDVLNNILIPIPSMKVQKKIISIIDKINYKITENIHSINTYIEIQRNLIWVNLLNNNNKIKLKDVVNIKGGIQITSSNITSSKYPIYGGNIKECYHNEFNCENNIIISKFDEFTNIKYIKEKFYLNQNGCAINIYNKKFLTEYVYIWLWYNQNNLFLNDNNILHQTNFLNTQIFDIDLNLQHKIITEFNYYENIKNILIKDNIRLHTYNIIDVIIKSFNNISNNIEIDNMSF
jgi:hypothetical protein